MNNKGVAESFFSSFECMHSDSDSSSESDEYDETSTDESSTDTYNSDEKDVFISIFDRIKNDYLTLISSSTEIEKYRKSYSELSKKSVKNIEKIWDDVLVYNRIFGQVPMKKYKHYINEYLNKNRVKKSNQNIHKNIPLNTNNPKKSVTVQNFCQCQQSNIKQNHVKEVSKTLPKKVEPKSQKTVSDKNSNSTQNIKSCLAKDQKSNVNLKENQKQNISNNIVDKKEKAIPINKKVIENDSKDNSLKSPKNNTEKHHSNDKSNITEFKKPIDQIPQPTLNNIPVKANIVHKNKNSSDNNKINDTSNINIVKLDTGSSKKKMKKQKQKEKRLENCKRDTSNSSSKEVSESCNKTPLKTTVNSKNHNIKLENKPTKNQDKKSANGKNKKNLKVHESTEESDIDDSKATDLSTSDDNIDFLTDSENIPTFFTEVIKRKGKSKNKTTKTVENVKNIDKTGDFVKPNTEDFMLHTRKREPSHQKKGLHISEKEDIIYSDKFAERAIDMVLENKLIGALQYLIEAMHFNPTDHRHYLNRCYCYLRICKYPLALEDARYVIHTSTNIGHLFIANLRAGQAEFALENYQLAEDYLKEAIYINPENHYVQRELLRVKVTRIVSMGFKEKDALLALEMCPSTLDAIDYLTNKNKTSVNNNSLSNNFDIIDDNYNELVYSSDEDEKPTNIEIANRILHYDLGKTKLTHIVAKPSIPSLISSPSVGKNVSNKNNVDKKVTLNNKMANKQFTEKAIWIGSLNNSVTDAMLKKNFKKFGNVISIYRPLNETYAFINFEKNEEVAKALACPSSHEIAGIKLSVRTAVRQK